MGTKISREAIIKNAGYVSWYNKDTEVRSLIDAVLNLRQAAIIYNYYKQEKANGKSGYYIYGAIVTLNDNAQYRGTYIPVKSATDFYSNAVACCDEVISSGAYSIEDNYFTNFRIKNENSKENIFVLVEDGNASFDLRYNGSMMNKMRMLALTNHYGLQDAYGLVEKPWNGFCARPTYIERFNERDVRGPGPAPKGITNEDLPAIPAEWSELSAADLSKKIKEEFEPQVKEFSMTVQGYGTQRTEEWGWFVGPVFDGSGNKIVIDDKDFGAIITSKLNFNATKKDNNRCDGARMQKYEVDKAGSVKWAENDFVLMRYADVLWMKEEAIKRGGAGASGVNTSDFQTMLKRSFAYSSDPKASFEAHYGDVASWTVDQILDERGREFAWELIRRRDLIRFDKFKDVEFVTAKDSYRNWFPIPYAVLQKSLKDENGNSIWTQNAGYVGSSGL